MCPSSFFCMDYFSYQITTDLAQNEVLIALLSHLPFDTFEENETGFCAYLPVQSDSGLVQETLADLQNSFVFQFEKTFIPGQNWNVIWESNFQPVQVGDFCGIRADFHEPLAGVRYELVINPKMAFGTGHHETTFSVISLMKDIPFEGKTVLDYGCGTGVLAILASKLGASRLEAVDIEEESYLNTIENSRVNRVENIKALKGTLDDVPPAKFDIVLANINRNVILTSLAPLSQMMNQGGTLVVSGFVLEDEAIMTEALAAHGFPVVKIVRNNNWLAMQCQF